EVRDHRREVGPAVTEELGQRAIHDPGSIARFMKFDSKRLPQPGLWPRYAGRRGLFGRHRKRRSGREDSKSPFEACPSAGFSGRAAPVGAAFLVGIASDASVLA